MGFRFTLLLIVHSILIGNKVTSALRAQQSPCYEFLCGTEPSLLCGSDGVTYINSCVYSQAQCKDSTLYVVKPGACEIETTTSLSSTTENLVEVQELDSTTTSAPTDNCADPFCSTEYKPVCGKDGITYSNLCQFTKAQCRNSGLALSHDGRCKSNENCLSRICPISEDSLCANDGKTYRNSCELSIAKCYNQALAPVSPGACAVGEDTIPFCETKCEDQYRPVCATDGQTYPNVCFFENARCKNPKLKIYKFEPC